MNGKDLLYLKSCIQGAKLFSTCDKRQYMAIIVDNFGYEIGRGYNGSPKGYRHCNQGACPRLFTKDTGDNYDNCIAIHAEQNALLHSEYTARREGATIYVNGIPCFTCAKLIANSGINRIAAIDDAAGYRNWTQTKTFLIEAGITIDIYSRGEVDSLPEDF